jgi:hypothetical protein
MHSGDVAQPESNSYRNSDYDGDYYQVLEGFHSLYTTSHGFKLYPGVAAIETP